MFALSLLASSDDNGGSAAGAVVQIGILLLIPVGMYFLMIRPQRRRMRAQAEMQSSLDVGDEVITTAGIYGFITGFDDDKVWLEIDDDVQVRVARAALQGKVDTAATPADAPTKSDSSTDPDTES
ncbi:MAG: preprotein translocase subunit YajC [Actinomycetota bacterium]|nr:preprotein translocase subunit YajC [Actinomycetota bacterium]